MLAGNDDRSVEEFLGLLQIAAQAHLSEHRFDVLVLRVNRLVLAELVETMGQRLHDELVLHLAVSLLHGVEHAGQRTDFAQRLQLRGRALHVVEEVVEDDVFGEQGVGDFHWRVRLAGLAGCSIARVPATCSRRRWATAAHTRLNE